MNLELIKQTPGNFSAERFYNLLFTNHPALRAAFPEKLQEQHKSLNQALANLLLLLELGDTEQLSNVLQQLGKRHAKYGATPELYGIVGETFLASLEPLTLGEHLAWSELYSFISTTMQKG